MSNFYSELLISRILAHMFWASILEMSTLHYRIRAQVWNKRTGCFFWNLHILPLECQFALHYQISEHCALIRQCRVHTLYTQQPKTFEVRNFCNYNNVCSNEIAFRKVINRWKNQIFALIIEFQKIQTFFFKKWVFKISLKIPLSIK